MKWFTAFGSRFTEMRILALKLLALQNLSKSQALQNNREL